MLAVLRETGPSGGQLVTLEQRTGGIIEGPHDGAPLSEHAPVFSNGKVFVISKIGKLYALDLAGMELFSKPDNGSLGPTSPLAVAPDGSIRVGTASELIGFDAKDGAEKFRTSAGGVISTLPAIKSDGTTYAATDLGRVFGVSSTGGVVFDRMVDAPASGVSVAPNGDVIAGEASGLRIFDSSGNEKLKHPRGARVVGTRVLENGDIVAWGEDGIVELLSSDGSVRFVFKTAASSPPPVYIRPLALSGGGLGIIDSAGTAHVVDPNGVALATLSLGAEPLREVSEATGSIFVAQGSTVRGIGFVIVEE